MLKRKIVIGLLKILALSVRKKAKIIPNGIEGSFAFIFALLPLIGAALFCWAGFFILGDPNPRQHFISVVPFAIASLFIGVTIHRLTFKIVSKKKQITTHSLLRSDRTIHLNRPFELEKDDEIGTLNLQQNSIKLDIASTMNGYQDFFDEVNSQYNQSNETNKNMANKAQ